MCFVWTVKNGCALLQIISEECIMRSNCYDADRNSGFESLACIYTMNGCQLCARNCMADRSRGVGICGSDETVRIARAALHMWEEPCISGKEGSGAVFFTGCPLHCVFCQNREIAVGAARGRAVTIPELASIFLKLQNKERANNINLVTPTHFAPQIAEAVEIARHGSTDISGSGRGQKNDSVEEVAVKSLHIPVVYNTAAVETPKTVRMLEGVVDVFLPDLKYYDRELSAKYSFMPEYFDVASKAIEEMVRISGPPRFDERGMMTRGTIVRHLVLPGHTKDSEKILSYLYAAYGDDIYISIMNQYTPMSGIGRRYPELARKVTRREYEKVVDYALSIGIENAFIQEGGTQKESFIPAFDGTGCED